MKCTNCGAEIQDGAKFCESCGAPQAAPTPVAPTPEYVAPAAEAPQAQAYEAPQAAPIPEVAAPQAAPTPAPQAAPTPAPQVAYTAPAPAPVSQKANVWSLILGIAGLSSCWLGCLGLFGLFSIAICIVGLAIGGKAKKAPAANKMCKTGWILSLIGLILAALLTIIFTIAIGAAIRYYY